MQCVDSVPVSVRESLSSLVEDDIVVLQKKKEKKTKIASPFVTISPIMS